MNTVNTQKLKHNINKNTASSSHLKVGELLVYEGFATNSDINKALSIQAEEKEFKDLPIGKILIKMGALSEDDIDIALKNPSLRKNIGTLSFEKGLIRKEDLDTALKNKKPDQFIGDILLSYGLLTHNDIGALLKEQLNSPKLGQILIDLKLVSENILQEALKKQSSTRAVGEILCDLKIITPHDLHYVLEKHNKQIEIDVILLKMGIISQEKINSARKESEKTSQPLESVLIKKKNISSEQLQTALAKKFNLPFEHLNDFSYTEKDKVNLTRIIQQKYAEKNLVLPLSINENHLKIAIFKPEILSMGRDLSALFPSLKISFVFITKEKFEEFFEILFSKSLCGELSQDQNSIESEDMDFMDLDLDENIDEKDEQGLDYGSQDIEAEEIVNFIIKYGILNNASDIHIEQDRQGPTLRYRIDGMLRESNAAWLRKKLPEKINSIVSRIKVMSTLDITERRMPQDGVFRTNFYDKSKNKKFDLDFRVATCRAIVGENITIRILDSRKANIGLENLGHSPHVLEPFKRLLKSASGIILVSGPTGSGKSSSLYAALQFVYNPGVKIITAEDPIEYSFPGIMQTQINPKISLTFSRLLRSFLRLDPDIILVGEIRDNETSTIAFDAAQTGHLLLSTIHTNDSVSAVSRLVDLDIDQKQIASCLLAVLAQRLIRRVCPSCKKEYVPEEDEWKILFDSYPSHLIFYKGEGCESCNFTGYSGRLLISEIFVVDKKIGMALSDGINDAQLKKLAIDIGMESMLEDGLRKLNETTLSELIRVIPQNMIETFRMKNNSHGQANNAAENVNQLKTQESHAAMYSKIFDISNPEQQAHVIEEMFANFKAVNPSNNNTDNASLSLFKEFVTDSYYKICSENNCSKIRFSIKNKNGNPEISAFPEAR